MKFEGIGAVCLCGFDCLVSCVLRKQGIHLKEEREICRTETTDRPSDTD